MHFFFMNYYCNVTFLFPLVFAILLNYDFFSLNTIKNTITKCILLFDLFWTQNNKYQHQLVTLNNKVSFVNLT